MTGNTKASGLQLPWLITDWHTSTAIAADTLEALGKDKLSAIIQND